MVKGCASISSRPEVVVKPQQICALWSQPASQVHMALVITEGQQKGPHVHDWNSAPAVNLGVDLEEAVGESLFLLLG